MWRSCPTLLVTCVKLNVLVLIEPARTADDETRHPLTITPTHRFPAKLRGLSSDEGAATAEYAIATMAAVGFAGLLVVIMRSDEVRGILTDLVRRALTFAG